MKMQQRIIELGPPLQWLRALLFTALIAPMAVDAGRPGV
jgi:hypothetical protein